MQRKNKDAEYKVEVKNSSNGNIEIRYFDDLQDSSYLSWRLSENVLIELISWWKKLRKNKNLHFPVKTKTKICVLTMNTEKYIEIKEFDCFGRFKFSSWSLPIIVVEELINSDEKNK